MKTTYELELTRNDVTPAQFLAYVRSACKRHGISYEMDSRYFAEGEKVNGEYWNASYNGGTPNTRPCISEVVKSLPYDHQTFLHNFDGSVYNEIVEFDFDDEKTGHGYFYIVQKDADSAEDAIKAAEAVVRYHENAISRNARNTERIRQELAETMRNIGNGWSGDYAQGHADMIAREIEMLERENAEHAEAIAEMRTTETTETTETGKPERQNDEQNKEGKKMLKSNSKQARENIRAYIIDKFDATNYSPAFDYIEQAQHSEANNKDIFSMIAHAIATTFNDEYLRHDNRYKAGRVSRYDLFRNWCAGLPSILDTCYYYNRSAVDDLAGILEESDAEKTKFDERQAEERLTWLIYREIYRVADNV